MIKPLDTNHHVSTPWFPHGFDAANIRSVRTPRRQENSTVTYLFMHKQNIIFKLLSNKMMQLIHANMMILTVSCVISTHIFSQILQPLSNTTLKSFILNFTQLLKKYGSTGEKFTTLSKVQLSVCLFSWSLNLLNSFLWGEEPLHSISRKSYKQFSS